jgi:hypothetical protein
METLRMSVEERRRLVVLSRVKSAELCLVRAGDQLPLSEAFVGQVSEPGRCWDGA